MSLHIYRAKDQKATHFVDDCAGPEHRRVVRYKPRKRLPCFGCGKWRWAANLTVQVYYDAVRFFCMKGKGCKRG